MIALEADPDLPGCRTRYAQVHYVPDINGCGLITALQSLRQNLPSNPVLILTNDTLYTTIFYTSEISVYDDAPLDDRDRVGRP